MIPVCVLTGFLGSGKTTLLGRLLRSPAFSRTAVIVNEFGEVGLDHDLIETSEESFVELQTGGLCCTIRGERVLSLEALLARRCAGAGVPSCFGDVEPERLFDMGAGAAPGKRPDLQAWLGLGEHDHHGSAAHDPASHDAQISCFAVLREEPIRAVALTLLLETLAEHC